MNADDLIWLLTALAVVLMIIGLGKMCWPLVAYVQGFM